jgi:ADP-ribose pyrophosphatase YjhB (NUDIX family)
LSSSRLTRLAAAVPSYARIAWWGLAAPRLTERDALVVHQGVVLADDGRVLLALRSELQGWELPGGEALPGESGEQAVAREIREETGVAVDVEACVAEYARTGFRPHLARIYRCRARGGAQPRAGDDTRGAAFFPLRALPDTLFPWCRGPLADALAPGTSLLRRQEHQGVTTILAALVIDLRMRLSP